MIHQIPIQPFDDTLRDRLFRTIAGTFEEQYQKNGTSYDPDTCGEAADRVIALLVGGLLGVKVTLKPSTIIGNGTLIVDTNQSNLPGPSGTSQSVTNTLP